MAGFGGGLADPWQQEAQAGEPNGRSVMTDQPARAAQALSRRARGALAAIVVLYVALAVLYSYATRLKFGPDEPAHFVYIQSVALDGRLPTLGDRNTYQPRAAVSHQRQQPPLYYALAALVYRTCSGLPGDVTWRALRFLSITIGLAVLGVQWRLLRLLYPENAALCLAGLAILAFLPMFTFITAVVSNDPLAVLLSTLAIYQWCRLLAGRAGLGDVALAGALVGLAVLTKESALALAPGLAIVAATTGRPALKTPARRIGRIALALVIAGAVCGGWFAYNVHTYGSPTVYFYHRPFYETLRQALTHPMGSPGRPGLVAVLELTLERTLLFLWVPWWATGERIPKAPYLAVLVLLSVAALVGLTLAWIDRRRGRPGLTALQSYALALMLATVGVLVVGIMRYVLFVDYTALQAGRYFVLVWPAMATLGVVGVSTLLVRPRARAAALSLLVGLWLAGNCAVLWLVHLWYSAGAYGAAP